ncbi:hypothetical protein WMF04_01500 [Sorangium sp. So ce260]|uniref:hypothetical protein n=1 Tax=Sorangium sp. So ce260 TaxID=3133291 RepID=UPI003F643236
MHAGSFVVTLQGDGGTVRLMATGRGLVTLDNGQADSSGKERTRTFDSYLAGAAVTADVYVPFAVDLSQRSGIASFEILGYPARCRIALSRRLPALEPVLCLYDEQPVLGRCEAPEGEADPPAPPPDAVASTKTYAGQEPRGGPFVGDTIQVTLAAFGQPEVASWIEPARATLHLSGPIRFTDGEGAQTPAELTRESPVFRSSVRVSAGGEARLEADLRGRKASREIHALVPRLSRTSTTFVSANGLSTTNIVTICAEQESGTVKLAPPQGVTLLGTTGGQLTLHRASVDECPYGHRGALQVGTQTRMPAYALLVEHSGGVNELLSFDALGAATGITASMVIAQVDATDDEVSSYAVAATFTIDEVVQGTPELPERPLASTAIKVSALGATLSSDVIHTDEHGKAVFPMKAARGQERAILSWSADGHLSGSVEIDL